MNIRFLSILTLVFSMSSAQAADVDSKAISEAMDKIAALTLEGSDNGGVHFGMSKVKGETLKECLTDYAQKNYSDDEEIRILMRMTAEEVPQSEEDPLTVGLGKNVDVVFLATMAFTQDIGTREAKKLEKKILALLFDITKAGGYVGAESRGWSTCGVYFPSLIVVDPSTKKVYTLRPTNTDC